MNVIDVNKYIENTEGLKKSLIVKYKNNEDIINKIIKEKINLNGIFIESRSSDGYINATSLCKAGNKQFKSWYKTNRSKRYLKALEKYYHTKQLIFLGKSRSKPTFVHPKVAIHIAQWINVDFEIIVSNWAYQIILGKIENKYNYLNDDILLEEVLEDESDSESDDNEYKHLTKRMLIKQLKQKDQNLNKKLAENLDYLLKIQKLEKKNYKIVNEYYDKKYELEANWILHEKSQEIKNLYEEKIKKLKNIINDL